MSHTQESQEEKIFTDQYGNRGYWNTSLCDQLMQYFFTGIFKYWVLVIKMLSCPIYSLIICSYLGLDNKSAIFFGYLILPGCSFTDIHQNSQASYTTPCNGVVSHGAQFVGLQVFADHTSKKKKRKAKQMRSRSLPAVQCFVHVCLHAQIALHAGNIHI